MVFLHEMDSAEDRVIEAGYSVYGKKNDTMAKLQFAKEHRDQLIASNILRRALFQVYVCFVQKNAGIPMIGGLKHARKLNFHCR